MSVHHSILRIHILVERSNVTEKHPFPTNCLLIMSGIIFQQPKSHPQQNKPQNSRVWNLNISGRYHDLNPAHLCHWKHRNCGVTRWFNSWPFHPLLTLVGVHSTIWKGQLAHPKTITKNWQECTVSWGKSLKLDPYICMTVIYLFPICAKV